MGRNKEVDPRHLLSTERHPQNIKVRLEQRFLPHVKPLNEWVLQLKSRPDLPAGAGATIPWFDPRGGGINAPIIFVQQDPSRTATMTQFCSPDNDDLTANNATKACRQVGLSMESRLHWNIFPWWVNVRVRGVPVDPSRPSQTYVEAERLAAPLLIDLLNLLKEPKVLVLLGGQSQKAFDGLGLQAQLSERGIHVLRCPSFSPQSWNNADATGTPRSEIIIRTLEQASDLARA